MLNSSCSWRHTAPAATGHSWCTRLLTPPSLVCPAGQLGLADYDNRHEPVRVGAVEKEELVELYRGVPDDVQLAVVSAGSSHTASISRR